MSKPKRVPVANAQALRSFTKEELESASSTKLKDVAKLLSNEKLLERIRMYKETYWDQKWGQTW